MLRAATTKRSSHTEAAERLRDVPDSADNEYSSQHHGAAAFHQGSSETGTGLAYFRERSQAPGLSRHSDLFGRQ